MCIDNNEVMKDFFDRSLEIIEEDMELIEEFLNV